MQEVSGSIPLGSTTHFQCAAAWKCGRRKQRTYGES